MAFAVSFRFVSSEVAGAVECSRRRSLRHAECGMAVEVGSSATRKPISSPGPTFDATAHSARFGSSHPQPLLSRSQCLSVFAAGDAATPIKRRTSAVGEGAMAIAFVHRYLASG